MNTEAISMDTADMPWEEHYVEAAGKALYRKILIQDPETGVRVIINRYPAGFVNPRHDHPCAHGMYVLEGILHTSEGDFGPRSFVWFPEGNVMWHGATAEQDAVCVFVTNKTFGINHNV